MRDQEAAKYIYPLAKGYKVLFDAEGYPYLPGKYGNIEWHSKGLLALYTTNPKMVAKFLAIPGVQRHQMGDLETRMLFLPSALPLALKVAKTRRKRVLSPEQARALGRGTAFKGDSK